MELLGSNLKEYEAKQPGGIFQPQIVYKLIMQLIERIRILHEVNSIHGDLKLQNMVMGPGNS
jgi:serine/threonine protein kinase